MFKTCIRGLLAASLAVCSIAFAEPVNVNTADAQSLAAALNGVGEKKAEAIVAYRDQHGPFASPEDLAKVPGIGEQTVARNRADILIAPGE